MNSLIEPILRDIGLTEYEARIYLALLDIGKATSGEILNRAELRTGKIYEILNSLAKKGLISIITENNVKKFAPANPERVYEYFHEQHKVIEEKEKGLKNILPELIKRANSHKSRADIEIFIGKKAMKSAYLKELERYKKEQTLYVMGVLSEKDYPKPIYDFFIYNIYPKREASKVKIKKLLSENAKKSRAIEKGSEVRYLPYGSLTSINIIGDLVIMGIFLEEPIIITIESPDVAKGFVEQFNLLWKIAKK
jgi:sugar-specific transcriptional regulator TrmB